jgi:hypothetical protein
MPEMPGAVAITDDQLPARVAAIPGADGVVETRYALAPCCWLAPLIPSYGTKTGEVRILSPSPAITTVGIVASPLFIKAPRPPQ